MPGRPGTDVRGGVFGLEGRGGDRHLGSEPGGMASRNPAHPFSLGTWSPVIFRTLPEVGTVIVPFHRHGNSSPVPQGHARAGRAPPGPARGRTLTWWRLGRSSARPAALWELDPRAP